MSSPRIQEAIDTNRCTVFVIPYCGDFLRVVAWQTEDGDYDNDNILQMDIYGDRACSHRLIAEEIDWANLSDLSSVFLEIRTQQFAREDRQRALRGLARLNARFEVVAL